MRFRKFLVLICGVVLLLADACVSVGPNNSGAVTVGLKNEVIMPVHNHYYSQETINYYINYHTEIIEAIKEEIQRTERTPPRSTTPAPPSADPDRSSSGEDLNDRLREAQRAKLRWQELLRDTSFMDYDALPTVRLSNAAELPYLIRNNVNIVIRPGTYVIDPLHLKDVRNLSISSAGPGPVELICKDLFSPVITISGSRRVRLKDLILGHEAPAPGPKLEDIEFFGGCGGPWPEDGAVVHLRDSGKIEISGCKLFGCGTFGIYKGWTDREKDGSVSVFNSEIYQCTYSAIYLEAGAQELSFCRGRIFDNEVRADLLTVSASSRLHLADTQVFNNRTKNATNLISVYNLADSDAELMVDACTLAVNNFNSLSNDPQFTVFRNTRFSDNFFLQRLK